jgi:hypothetical protein
MNTGLGSLDSLDLAYPFQHFGELGDGCGVNFGEQIPPPVGIV